MPIPHAKQAPLKPWCSRSPYHISDDMTLNCSGTSPSFSAWPWRWFSVVATCGMPAGLLGSFWMAMRFADCLQQANNPKTAPSGGRELARPCSCCKTWTSGWMGAGLAFLECWMALQLACCRCVTGPRQQTLLTSTDWASTCLCPVSWPMSLPHHGQKHGSAAAPGIFETRACSTSCRNWTWTTRTVRGKAPSTMWWTFFPRGAHNGFWHQRRKLAWGQAWSTPPSSLTNMKRPATSRPCSLSFAWMASPPCFASAPRTTLQLCSRLRGQMREGHSGKKEQAVEEDSYMSILWIEFGSWKKMFAPALHLQCARNHTVCPMSKITLCTLYTDIYIYIHWWSWSLLSNVQQVTLCQQLLYQNLSSPISHRSVQAPGPERNC